MVYMCLLMYVVFFAETMGRAEVASGYKYNLTLFQEINRYLKYLGRWDSIGRIAFFNIVGNVLIFVPFGLFLPILTKGGMNVIFTTIVGFATSLAIEFTQLMSHVGCFDVDDLMLNTIGAFLGSLIYLLIGAVRKRL